MSGIVKIEDLKNLIIEIRDEKVLLDSDVAMIYGVETKRINEAVKNNPDKFPQEYLFELSGAEFADLRSKISTAKFAMTRVVPKAFTEKGLYMMATILRSKQAIEATCFSTIRDLSSGINKPSTVQDKAEQKSLVQKSGERIAEIFDDVFRASDTETSIEPNFAVLKFKHTIKKKKA